MDKNKSASGAVPEGKIVINVKSALPLWACGAVWVIAGLTLPMYFPVCLAAVATVSAAVYAVCRLFAGQTTETVAAPPKSSGDPEADRALSALSHCAGTVRKLRESLPADMAGVSVCGSLEKIASLLDKITENIKNDPSDLRYCRRMCSYYLPLTEKLCGKYRFVLNQLEGGGAEGAITLKMNLQRAFDSVASALEKLLDAMYENDNLDISTDISVLEELLHESGLSVPDDNEKDGGADSRKSH